MKYPKMKTLKFLLFLMLTGSSPELACQVNPVSSLGLAEKLNAAGFNIDSSRIVLCHHSFGGSLLCLLLK
jgi:hypothetical protein